MKKHNTVKVVLIAILVFLLLSWILPAAYYSGEYVDQGRVQMGLFDLLNYPLTALSYFGYIGFYLILVGGFYGVLYKIPAYRSFLDRIVKSFKGKEMIFISIVVVLFAAAVSICGLQVGFAFFVPLVVSVILLMGYDKIVAALTVIGSMTVGIAGSTFAYSNVNMLTSILSLKLDYQIGVRFVILLVGIVLVIFNIFMYIKRNNNVKIDNASSKKIDKAKDDEEDDNDDNLEEVKVEKVVKTTTKSKNNSSKSSNNKKGKSSNAKKGSSKSTNTSKSRKSDNKAALKNDEVIVVKESRMNDEDYLVPASNDKTHKIWPFVCGFTLMFILMVLSFITWGEGGFGVSLFDDITTSVTKFELFGFPIFAKVLGTVNSFGNWTLSDLFLPIILLTLLVSLIYKVKLDDILDGFAAGAKKALAPALVSILVYAVLVINTYHPYQLVIYKTVLGWSKGFNIVTTVLVSILSGIINSDIAYSIQSVMPYYTSIVTKSDNYAFAAVIYQSMYGLTMMFAPTGLILMSTLAYLRVSYGQWLKNVWKLLLEFFVILLIIFIILALI